MGTKVLLGVGINGLREVEAERQEEGGLLKKLTSSMKSGENPGQRGRDTIASKLSCLRDGEERKTSQSGQLVATLAKKSHSVSMLKPLNLEGAIWMEGVKNSALDKGNASRK